MTYDVWCMVYLVVMIPYISTRVKFGPNSIAHSVLDHEPLETQILPLALCIDLVVLFRLNRQRDPFGVPRSLYILIDTASSSGGRRAGGQIAEQMVRGKGIIRPWLGWPGEGCVSGGNVVSCTVEDRRGDRRGRTVPRLLGGRLVSIW